MSTRASGAWSVRRPARFEPADVVRVAGVVVAAAGVIAGLLVAAQVHRSCADSNIYRLVDLVCQHMRSTHPHLGAGLVLMAAAVIAGATSFLAGATLARRVAQR